MDPATGEIQTVMEVTNIYENLRDEKVINRFEDIFIDGIHTRMTSFLISPAVFLNIFFARESHKVRDTVPVASCTSR
jgi:hypothetical protein